MASSRAEASLAALRRALQLHQRNTPPNDKTIPDKNSSPERYPHIISASMTTPSTLASISPPLNGECPRPNGTIRRPFVTSSTQMSPQKPPAATQSEIIRSRIIPPHEKHRLPPPPTRNTQALRSELRALQEGLVQLKQTIAARRSRMPPNVMLNRTLTGVLEEAEAENQATSYYNARDNSTGIASRQPSTVPLEGKWGTLASLQLVNGSGMGNAEGGEKSPPTGSPFVFCEDALSHTDSAVPSAALNQQVLNALQSMTERLQRLECQQQKAGDEGKTNVAAKNPGVSREPPAQVSAEDTGILACLQTELTEERFRRIKLEALVRALCTRLDVEDMVDNSASEFDANGIMRMTAPELRAMVQLMSRRTKEALKTQNAAKCKAVQLQSALRSVSDLSARIVELEDQLACSPKSNPLPTGQIISDTIGDLSLKLRGQMFIVRALKHELDIIRNKIQDVHFEVRGLSEKDVQGILKSIDEVALRHRSPLASRVSTRPAPPRSLSTTNNGQIPANPPLPGLRQSSATVSPSDVPSPGENTPSTQISVIPSTAESDYVPVNDDEIDQAVANFVNNRSNKVMPTRHSSGNYLFGHLSIRIGLSAHSRKPLAFYEGKKYTLKKFISTFEDNELLYLKNNNKNFPAVKSLALATSMEVRGRSMAASSSVAFQGSPQNTLFEPSINNHQAIRRSAVSEGPGHRLPQPDRKLPTRLSPFPAIPPQKTAGGYSRLADYRIHGDRLAQSGSTVPVVQAGPPHDPYVSPGPFPSGPSPPDLRESGTFYGSNPPIFRSSQYILRR